MEPTGLLDGIDDESRKSGMSVLLENQGSQFVKEASATSTSSNKEEWSGVALPLVRRIFGELAAGLRKRSAYESSRGTYFLS